jgi:hypothetical protein
VVGRRLREALEIEEIPKLMEALAMRVEVAKERWEVSWSGR